MASLPPPFSRATAHQKVKVAQGLWNTRSPQDVVKAYTQNSIWRNRNTFLNGHAEIVGFLTAKWKREQSYRLRKELFAFEEGGNRIAVQFWYEYRDAQDGMRWKRCYGIEHWTFDKEGKMEKRMMSGNDLDITEEDRWFKDGVDVDEVELGESHF